MKIRHILLSGLALIGLLSCSSEATDKTEGSTPETASKNEVVENVTEEEPFAEGKAVYAKTCLPCHQENGMGIEGTFPPLAGSDYLLEDKTRAITQVMHGSEGEITVNGKLYSGIMPPQVLTDEEIRDVINYILNGWGNDGGEVSIEEVHAQRRTE